MAQAKESWGSRVGLILAMAGNAVGLGNFLRFPVQAVQNGGGAFIIPYIVCFVLLGIPLLLVEWSTGKFGGCYGNANSAPYILQSLNKRKIWKYVGGLGVFSNVIIASYYCYIESWTLSYVYHSIVGTFRGMTELQVSGFFDSYLDVTASTTGIPYEAVICYILCLALNIWILSRGLQKGVEVVAKICMPLLLVFGLFLAIKSYTLKAGSQGAIYDGTVGLNFLWQPNLSSLADPKVWLAAAGQIFFTLSLGMGCVQCYASYLKKKDDVVLNSMSAGFINEFCEIVIGSAIIIPIAVGYFGIDKVIELTKLGGFGLGFRSLPFLFTNWGAIMGAIAGIAFFGLLFFAGITSSLAMGSNVTALFNDAYGLNRKKSSYILGLILLVMGLPTVFFYQKGVFDEYDFWGGTVVLVLYAMFEVILFSWIIGVNKGWKMIHEGADMKMPIIFKYVLKYITPTMLIIIFLAAVIKPKDDNWASLSIKGWELDNSSIIGVLQHRGIGPNDKWFSDEYFSEYNGVVDNIRSDAKYHYVTINIGSGMRDIKFKSENQLAVNVGDEINVGDTIYKGKCINNKFYIDLSRIMLLSMFLILCVLIKHGQIKINKRKQTTCQLQP
ncbi:sodium-dependent transporter [Bacteroidales bacterium OttesenSCG-928-K03]|nr:sodium-dependent transporter [Bacteroidales bacterium OttesenSCG-928-L14]MDL2242859.1 sodium-dependent transporter [Bacteroidales bacterium OttesenSCG-928-K03]